MTLYSSTLAHHRQMHNKINSWNDYPELIKMMQKHKLDEIDEMRMKFEAGFH